MCYFIGVMKKKLSPQLNRTISILYLCIFIGSLVCLGAFGYMYYREYHEHLLLEEKYNQAIDEFNYIKDLYSKLDGDGYYNVYSDGEFVIYGDGSSIIVIS